MLVNTVFRSPLTISRRHFDVYFYTPPPAASYFSLFFALLTAEAFRVSRAAAFVSYLAIPARCHIIRLSLLPMMLLLFRYFGATIFRA